MEMKIGAKTYHRVNLVKSEQATIKQRQLDGFSVKDAVGQEFHLYKRGLVDRDKLDWSLPKGSTVQIDGKPYKTTSGVTDWGDTFWGVVKRIFGG